jgi:Domain of unknown function DUF11
VGPTRPAGATVAVLLPEGTAFAGLTTDTGTCAPPAADQPRVVVCDVGTLPAGGGAEVRVTAIVTAPAGATRP